MILRKCVWKTKTVQQWQVTGKTEIFTLEQNWIFKQKHSTSPISFTVKCEHHWYKLNLTSCVHVVSVSCQISNMLLLLNLLSICYLTFACNDLSKFTIKTDPSHLCKISLHILYVNVFSSPDLKTTDFGSNTALSSISLTFKLDYEACRPIDCKARIADDAYFRQNLTDLDKLYSDFDHFSAFYPITDATGKESTDNSEKRFQSDHLNLLTSVPSSSM